jgi:hypothetical protein
MWRCGGCVSQKKWACELATPFALVDGAERRAMGDPGNWPPRDEGVGEHARYNQAARP